MNVKLLTTDLTNVMDLLDDAFADAWELRMAVAFMTAPGVALLRKRLLEIGDRHPDRDSGSFAKVTVSVRWPTDLNAVLQLAKEFQGVVHVHQGWVAPSADDAKHVGAQMHSKVIALRRAGGIATVVVGSHNWTDAAMKGKNREASVRIDTAQDSPIAKEVRDHARAIWEDDPHVEPTDSNIKELIALQQSFWRLQQQPEPIQAGDLGFDPYAALVMDVLCDDPELLQKESLTVGFEVKHPTETPDAYSTLRGALGLGRKVVLYAECREGSLNYTRFDGSISMSNEVSDARVERRDTDAAVLPILRADSDAQPYLRRAEGMQAEVRRSPGDFQVAVTLTRIGLELPPVFHSGKEAPSVKPGRIKWHGAPGEGLVSPPKGNARRQDGSLKSRASAQWTAATVERDAPKVRIPFLARRERIARLTTERLSTLQRADAVEATMPPWASPWFFPVTHMGKTKP